MLHRIAGHPVFRLLLSSCPDLHQWCTVTWKYNPNKPFPLLSCFWCLSQQQDKTRTVTTKKTEYYCLKVIAGWGDDSAGKQTCHQSLMTWVYSLGPRWLKGRSKSPKFSSDLHIYCGMCISLLPQINSIFSFQSNCLEPSHLCQYHLSHTEWQAQALCQYSYIY